MRISVPLAMGLLWLAPAPAREDDGEIRYDPSTVVEVDGYVADIHEVAAPTAIRGIHITINSEHGGDVDAYLGPTSFVRDFIENFGKRSQVHVSGSKVKTGNSTCVLARLIRKGETTLYLRDERGNPLWTRTTRMLRRITPRAV